MIQVICELLDNVKLLLVSNKNIIIINVQRKVCKGPLIHGIFYLVWNPRLWPEPYQGDRGSKNKIGKDWNGHSDASGWRNISMTDKYLLNRQTFLFEFHHRTWNWITDDVIPRQLEMVIKMENPKKSPSTCELASPVFLKQYIVTCIVYQCGNFSLYNTLTRSHNELTFKKIDKKD